MNEADGHGVGDAVCCRLVGVEDAVELFRIRLVLCEKRTSEDIAEEQYDTDDFMRFDAARNNSFGEVAGVSLQGFEGAGFEGFDVAVVNRRCFGEDFLFGHGGKQPRFGNSTEPLFAELRTVLPEVSYEFA